MDQRAEMEELQKQLDEENEALRMTEEEAKKIKVERDRVEEELAQKRGGVRVKTEPVD